MTVTCIALRALLAALLIASFGVLPAAAQQFPMPLRYVTADGTWDCKDDAGVHIGTVVIVDTNYSFIKPDSKVAGYGKLHRVGEEQFDLPHYIILDGTLKDEFGFVGSSMRGPKDDYENFSTGIFFVLFDANSNDVDCTRRTVDGLLQ